jgi:hypothetical protein
MKARKFALPAIGEEIWQGINFLRWLPSFLRHPISRERAQTLFRRRLAERPARLINLIRRVAFSSPRSPYSKLMRWAGCELGDVERLVGQEGVEGTLKILFQKGVYVTVEEFKGRRPILRGRFRLDVEPRQFQSASRSSRLFMQTGGSRGQSTPVPINIDYLKSRSINSYTYFKALGGLQWDHGIWAVPGSVALTYMLELRGFGVRPARWFSQVDVSSPGFHPRYRWSAQAVRWTCFLSGTPVPKPVHASVDNPKPVLDWLRQVLECGRIPHLVTHTSSAMRLSEAALGEGVKLPGALITLTGEPITALRLANIRRCGATVMTRYGAADSGTIGYGCLAPENPDEVHLLTDRLALIQEEEEGEKKGIPQGAFFVTALEPSTSFFFLNVSLGDQGIIVNRGCGCPLDEVGWKTHLHSIMSFEKLTSEGMSFLRADVVEVLDEVLPKLFGGNPTHYQLLEEDDDQGRPHLRLLVHPDVGPVSSQAVADAFLEAIGMGRGVEKIMKQVWQDAKLVQVERRPPFLTGSGKIQHLHHKNQTPRMNG